MLKYVAEEVDRVKTMFEDKERRLTSQRDEALQTQRDAAARAAVLQGEALAAVARAADLEARLGTQPQQLEVRCSLSVRDRWRPFFRKHLIQAAVTTALHQDVCQRCKPANT